MKCRGVWSLVLSGALLSACGSGTDTVSSNTDNSTTVSSGAAQTLTDLTLKANLAAYIPPQCYTKTLEAAGRAHNPCMACHIPAVEPNYRDDGDLQLGYSFADYANTNHWTNLFKERTSQMAAISDASILDYVRQDNYQSRKGVIDLAETLKQLPAGWDNNRDGVWSGFLPDCYMNFDQEGFDHNPANQYTGWRAFAYTPFLGTFWPTNGSTDDVVMRLPEAFRQNEAGDFDLETYKLNLAIVEALITRKDVTIAPVDETGYGVDLNKDGILGYASRVRFDWAPDEGRNMSYVGKAKVLQASGQVHLAAGLYPEGTEFLHSVRYLDLDANGGVKLAARMKELRYSHKIGWQSYAQLQGTAEAEAIEKNQYPDALRQLYGDVEEGMNNFQGWVYQGFIEDKQGVLRPQTFEEMTACMGCHGGIGATTDSSFAFPRKLDYDSFQHGWYHWSEKGLKGIPEPKRADGQYEYTYYLEQNGAGDEFRENREVTDKFFGVNGLLKADKVEALHGDIAELLLPSAERAVALNKAYKVIVDEQSYIEGRDAVLEPPANIQKTVEKGQATGVTAIVNGPMN